MELTTEDGLLDEVDEVVAKEAAVAAKVAKLQKDLVDGVAKYEQESTKEMNDLENDANKDIEAFRDKMIPIFDKKATGT